MNHLNLTSSGPRGYGPEGEAWEARVAYSVNEGTARRVTLTGTGKGATMKEACGRAWADLLRAYTEQIPPAILELARWLGNPPTDAP